MLSPEEGNLIARMESVLTRLEVLMSGEVNQGSYPAWRRDLRKLVMAARMKPEEDCLRSDTLNLWRWVYDDMVPTHKLWVRMLEPNLIMLLESQHVYNQFVKATLRS
jgi:hypothetical protein